MDTNGNNHCDYMYGAVSVVIYYWHDQKICSCNNRYFFDCYCVTASYYHQNTTNQESIMQVILVAIVTVIATLLIFKRKVPELY